jgi:hypothetical protein
LPLAGVLLEHLQMVKNLREADTPPVVEVATRMRIDVTAF